MSEETSRFASISTLAGTKLLEKLEFSILILDRGEKSQELAWPRAWRGLC